MAEGGGQSPDNERIILARLSSERAFAVLLRPKVPEKQIMANFSLFEAKYSKN